MLRHLCTGALAATLLTVVPARAAAGSPSTDSTAYALWYRGLRSAAPDPSRGAEVTGLRIRRSNGALTLRRGTLHLLTPVDGRVYGAVFVGDGTFVMTVPPGAEQLNLERVFEVDTVIAPLTSAVIFFTDSTVAELEARARWTSLEPSSDARKEVKEALEYLTDGDGWVDRDLMVPLLDDVSGFFYAHMSRHRNDPWMYVENPMEAEPITLLRRATGKGKRREAISRFAREGDPPARQEELDLIRVDDYDISIRLAGNLDLAGRATAHLVIDPLRGPWIPFHLHGALEVDSLRWEDASAPAWERAEEVGEVWVDVSSAPSTTARLTFFYHGDILDRPDRMWVTTKTFTTWYPFHEYGRPATYRMTFVTPKRYSLAAVGSLVSSQEADGYVTSVLETEEVREVTFNLGEFETEEVESMGSGPPLIVQVNEGAHNQLTDYAARVGLLLGTQRNMAQTVGADLARAFAFFGQVYGSMSVPFFVASEIPYGHGQAFPGLVLLSWATFQNTTEKGYDEMFRAHEVAHQWWGIGVRPASDRDRWLAEGFSEFSGLWYMARVRGSTQLYQDRLEDTRRALLERRTKVGPVGLGTRAATSDDPGDYELAVYQKGAWVLHMLRMMMTDFDGSGEDRFEAGMHDFFTSYLGSEATTEDFQRTMEKWAGEPLDWFFRQWVYGTAIPTYTFSHKVDRLPDGRFQVQVSVRQDDIPPGFTMVVPVMQEFADGTSSVTKIRMSDPSMRVDMPITDMEPTRVVFNPFAAVLADVKTVGWEE